MGDRILEVTPRVALICLYYTVVANTIVAIFVADMHLSNEGLLTSLVFTQSIGCSACVFCLTIFYFIRPRNQFVQMIMVMTCMAVGAIFGSFLGSLIAADKSPSTYFMEQQDLILRNIYYTTLVGTLAVYLYIFHQKIFATEALVQAEKIKRLSLEKKSAETNLRLLQAQIEPHFLFNTLSNVLSLLETDANKGKSMMIDLIDYLRSSLQKTRSHTTTVAQEMATIRAYLNIFKTRMGDRLNFTISIPDTLKDYPFPPMLIQPLVENAIKHGIEPKIEGGVVTVTATQREDRLIIKVADSGLGLTDVSSWGIGISNIKERLESIFGDKAHLYFEDNQPCGLNAIIEIPYETDYSDHCG